jgi:putative membrane protein
MMQKLPMFHAILNTFTFTLLVAAYIHIKRGNRSAHAFCMRTAFVVSAIFLTSYLTYHFTQKPTPFLKEGWIRPVYFTILISHTILAVVVLPLIFKAFYHALKQDWEKHKSVVRWAWPIWTYVAFTGPVVYLMLYRL